MSPLTKDSEFLFSMRLIAAKVMAAAVLDIFPGVQLVGEHVSPIGFSYDFLFSVVLPEESLVLIEERMRAIMKQKIPLQKMDMMRKNAMELFRHHKQFALVDTLANDSSTLVEVWKMGDFYDLGAIPLDKSSGDTGFFKIFKMESVKQMTRISGTAFLDKQTLKNFLKKQDLAKRHDHLVLGSEMKLFSPPSESEQDKWIWLPKGSWIIEELSGWLKEQNKQQGYRLIRTPRSQNELGVDPSASAWKEYVPHAEAFVCLEPSQKELPLKFCESKETFENSSDAELCGLFKTRFFNVDQASTFCPISQVEGELNNSLQFIDKTVKMFGLEHRYVLSTESPLFGITRKNWVMARNWLVKALQSKKLEYTESDAVRGLGPSIEVHVSDALGRTWVTSRLSIDVVHPSKMVLRYRGADDMLHEPVMLTQTVYGPLERFVGLLLEQYAGVLPFWLAPEQVRVVPVSGKFVRYASEIAKRLQESGFRVVLDYSQGNLGAKVHAAEQQKVPYSVIVGDKEENNKTVTLRSCRKDENRTGLKLESVIELLRNENSRDKEENEVA